MWKVCLIVCQPGREYTTVFDLRVHSRVAIYVLPALTKSLTLALSRTVCTRSFIFCTAITLFVVFPFISWLMVLTLFQGKTNLKQNDCSRSKTRSEHKKVQMNAYFNTDTQYANFHFSSFLTVYLLYKCRFVA